MPNLSNRSRKVGEQIKRELAQLLSHEVKDPRISSMLTINAVEVSADLGQAKVYVTSLQSGVQHTQLIKILDGMAGFLRGELGRSLSLRVIPKLKFIYDTSVEDGAKMSQLIDKAMAEDRQKASQRQDDPEDDKQN